MSEPRIIVGEGHSKEEVKTLLTLVAAQALAAGHDLRLPAMKRCDKGPFNKSKEQERRAKQIQRAKDKRGAP